MTRKNEHGTPLHLEDAIYRDNGNPEVSATWAASHRDAFRLIDVREPHELTGPLGAIEGADNVPLHTLLTRGLPDDESAPIVLVCRSGRRSALAALTLAGAGYTNVASVEGGMLAWNLDVLHREGIVEDEKHANAKNLEGAIYRTNGVPEVSAQWVHQNLGRFRLVDVRELAERRGPMGFIVQAEHVPLQHVLAMAADWPRDQPVVVHCASGGRSARAAMALAQMGFTKVASMEGGMMAWRALMLP